MTTAATSSFSPTASMSCSTPGGMKAEPPGPTVLSSSPTLILACPAKT